MSEAPDRPEPAGDTELPGTAPPAVAEPPAPPTAQAALPSAPEGPPVPAQRRPEPPSVRPADEPVAEKVRKDFDAESTKGKQPTAPGAMDDDDRVDYDPEEQQQRERFQKNQSRADRGAAASGPNARAYYHDRRVYHAYFGGRKFTVQYGVFGPAYVAAEVRTYVAVPNVEVMREALGRQHLIRLCGEVGSGRRTTAIKLLDEVGCLRDRIGTVEVDDDLIFSVLAEDCVMERGAGIIIDRDDRPMRDGAVDALRRRARDTGAFVVILDSTERANAEASFAHERPDHQEVLRRHLWVLLASGATPARTRDADQADRAYHDRAVQHPAVASRIRLASSVRYVVRLAEHLAGNPDREGDLDQLLADWDNQSRKLAKDILAPAEESAEKAYLIPHRQAFRIAYAVFAGHPLSDVFHAGELLSQQIIPLYETRGTTPDRLIFDGNIDRLIHPSMVAPARGDEQRPGPRCAELADETLIRAILDVAWHDYDALRGPLMTWLMVLAGNRSWKVRLRAAQIVGILAGFDFDQVYRVLIGVWARWQATYRRSAALAMDMAYVDARLTRRVRQRVYDWSRSPDPLLQDSAARVYGMRLGEEDVPRAVRELARMGRQPELAASSSVAAAMSMLFLAGATDDVMDELADWVASPNEHLPQHAVRALVILARQPGSVDRQGWPALPELAERRERWQRALVDLWRNALTNAETSRRAWDPMRKWLLAADHDEKLRAFVESLAMEIFASPLDSRARFNLRLWRNRHPDAVLIAALIRRLAPGTTREATDGES
ncbi:hypothetical protein ACWENR_14995 [Micromonospora sp. NPDC004336]